MYYYRFLCERERVSQVLSNKTSKALQLQIVLDEVGRGVYANIEPTQYNMNYKKRHG